MKCCKCERETPQTVCAPHPGASVYCPDCGVCGYCGVSVEHFVFMERSGVWMCSCGGYRKPKPRGVTRVPLFGAEMTEKRPAWI